ncbi:hypothetical protein KM043_006761 [Ampulex compressa]|nr:hypothetical protein KM043_006761 [Ampulex compressa]
MAAASYPCFFSLLADEKPVIRTVAPAVRSANSDRSNRSISTTPRIPIPNPSLIPKAHLPLFLPRNHDPPRLLLCFAYRKAAVLESPGRSQFLRYPVMGPSCGEERTPDDSVTSRSSARCAVNA